MRNRFNTVEPWRRYQKGVRYQQMFQEYALNFSATIISFQEIPMDLQEKYLERGFAPALVRGERPYGELVCSIKIVNSHNINSI